MNALREPVTFGGFPKKRMGASITEKYDYAAFYAYNAKMFPNRPRQYTGSDIRTGGTIRWTEKP